MTSLQIVMSPLNITPLDIPKIDMSPLSIQIYDMPNMDIPDLEIPSPLSNQNAECVYRRNINIVNRSNENIDTNLSYQESVQEMEWIIMNELTDPNTSHSYFYFTIIGIAVVPIIFMILILIQ
jgi:hypothetical protein